MRLLFQIAALPGKLPLLALHDALQEAADEPGYSLAGAYDGSALAAGELHLAILIEMLRVRDVSTEDLHHSRIERLLRAAMCEPYALSLASKEVALIIHSIHIVHELARREDRSLQNGYAYWLAMRLYAWLVAQLSTTADYGLVIELFRHCNEPARREDLPPDLFAVGWFGKDGIDHRLLMTLGALSMGLDLQTEAISIDNREPERQQAIRELINTENLFRFSKPMIQMLVELASRPLNEVERGIRGPRSPGSIFGWDLPSTVPDLALLVLLQHDYSLVLELKPEVRIRFWKAFIAGELDPRQTSFLVKSAVSIAESLTHAEREILNEYISDKLLSEKISLLSMYLATELFASGSELLREPILDTLLTHISVQEVSILIERYFLGLARVAKTIDEVQNVLQRVIEAALNAKLDLVTFLSGYGHILVSGPITLREPAFKLFETIAKKYGVQDSEYVVEVRTWMMEIEALEEGSLTTPGEC